MKRVNYIAMFQRAPAQHPPAHVVSSSDVHSAEDFYRSYTGFLQAPSGAKALERLRQTQRPPVVAFFDAPFGGEDAETKRILNDEYRRVFVEKGKTFEHRYATSTKEDPDFSLFAAQIFLPLIHELESEPLATTTTHHLITLLRKTLTESIDAGHHYEVVLGIFAKCGAAETGTHQWHADKACEHRERRKLRLTQLLMGKMGTKFMPEDLLQHLTCSDGTDTLRTSLSLIYRTAQIVGNGAAITDAHSLLERVEKMHFGPNGIPSLPEYKAALYWDGSDAGAIHAGPASTEHPRLYAKFQIQCVSEIPQLPELHRSFFSPYRPE